MKGEKMRQIRSAPAMPATIIRRFTRRVITLRKQYRDTQILRERGHVPSAVLNLRAQRSLQSR